MGGMPECPHEWTKFANKQVQDTVVNVGSDGLSLSRATTNVPEYNDCQRLIRAPGEYGPLVAIFAAFRLDSVAFKLDTLGGPATVMREEPPSIRGGEQTIVRTEPVTSPEGMGVPFAQIFNHDSAAYPQLGLDPGFNCLYLYWKDLRLEARMVPVQMHEERCAQPFDPASPSGKVLTVHRRMTPIYTNAADFPAVARWDWDADSSQHYISIRCGATAWCDVGSPKMASSASYLVVAEGSSGEERVRFIKGWYDEQPVAVPHATEDRWIPGTLATVVPDPILSTRTLGDYGGKWVPTGYIALDQATDYYDTRMNLKQVTRGADLASMNKLEMCFGTRDECDIPGASALQYTRCGTFNWFWTTWKPRWWARITAAGDTSDVMYKCVIRRDHEDKSLTLGVPGTARWRWMPFDETVWEACTEGCCEVTAGS